MARRKGSKNKGMRAKPRSAYEAYSYWYDKYSSGYKAGWFHDKLSPAEFSEEYEMARRAKVANPAKTIATEQRYVSYDFAQKYKSLYGKNLGDVRDSKVRQDLFWEFTDALVQEGMDFDDARKEFEEYFY